jgi:citrate synthase
MARPLTTAEAARRLGVKPATLYAYVSRGMLRRQLADDGRTSRFDAADIERLARRGRRARGRGGALDVVLTTAVTRLDDRSLRFRGHDPAVLAGTEPFEAVARMLWTGQLDAGPMVAESEVLDRARAALAVLGDDAPPLDRLRIVIAVTGATDPYRADLRLGAVVAAGGRLVGALAEALPLLGPTAPALDVGGHRRPGSVAERLWPRLTARRATGASVRALNAALVLLADHELALSTMAARVAASGRAHPYACVSAGLGALEGFLHGGASRRVHELLSRCERPGDAPRVIGDILRDGLRVPGFGHVVYRDVDPRVEPLLRAVRAAGGDRRRLEIVDAVLAAAGDKVPAVVNVELAVAALTFTSHMARDSGELVFAVARTAGWLAHAIEEYEEHPMRLRGRAIYVGP